YWVGAVRVYPYRLGIQRPSRLARTASVILRRTGRPPFTHEACRDMSLPDGYPSDQDGAERYVWILDGLDQRPETDTREDPEPVVRLQVIDDRGRRGGVG
ncbi:MAG: hypothetical protein OEY28_02370, partial [Nitrospira sp.]|nr:hypothetical protein [Nitrospira sp.]